VISHKPFGPSFPKRRRPLALDESIRTHTYSQSSYIHPNSMLTRRLPALARPFVRYSSATPTPTPPVASKQPSAASPADVQQSPNVPTTWSTSQAPKPFVFDGPRFEQTKFDLQPNAPSAMGMVMEDPVRLVDGRRASCDGGKSAFCGVVVRRCLYRQQEAD
jgi:NADH dehydrogenase (ubiquinone) Fe-S protein 6